MERTGDLSRTRLPARLAQFLVHRRQQFAFVVGNGPVRGHHAVGSASEPGTSQSLQSKTRVGPAGTRVATAQGDKPHRFAKTGDLTGREVVALPGRSQTE